MGRRGMLGLLASGTATLLSGCLKSRVSLRYRLTLEVRTPGGIKTGSSVLQNTLSGQSIIPLPGDIGGSGFIGEAPTVDLGSGRFLFAVLADPLWRRNVFEIVSKVLSYPELKLVRPDEGTMDRMKKAAETKPSAILRREHYPMLVTFADVNDPSSVKEVSPDNLAASFGAGYALEKITFQAVDEKTPLTTGFKERFPAIANHRGAFGTKPPNALRTQNLDADLQAFYFFSGALK